MTEHGQTTVTILELLNRPVVDEDGHTLGRVYEFQAEKRDGELCISHLLVGPSAWVTRLGWRADRDARKIAWEDIVELSPAVRVKQNRR